MVLPDPQFARSDVLRVFNHGQIYLRLASAIATVGLLASFLCLLRRRADSLLLWFSLFAVLYGVRLMLNYQLLWALGLRPVALQRFVIALSFLIAIPGFFFFRALNLLGRRGRILLKLICPVALFLALNTLLFGNREINQRINNIFLVAALATVLFWHSALQRRVRVTSLSCGSIS